MRALVQRVTRASVEAEGEEVASIGPGLLVLLGVAHDDTEADADRLAERVRALRVFDDSDGRMNEPLNERDSVLQGVRDPALEQYRWMLEELRVSLFAQELKTAIPVSVKRLQAQWAQVRA